jgi:hypothetical protein
MARKQSNSREYKFSDPELKNASDNIIGNVQRDRVQFETRGVTDQKVAQVQAMIAGFADMPTDVELIGAMAAATLNKDTIAETIRIKLRSVRTMAQNVHGAKSPLYRSFGFEGMDKMTDDQLYLQGKRTVREATAQMAQLSAEGLTAAMLNALQTLLADFENAIHEKQEAEKNRDIQTQLRVDAGNALYREIMRFANTGKDIWASTNEALYNDYVIYTSPAGTKPEDGTTPGMISGTLTNTDTGDALPEATVLIDGTETATITDEDGDFAFDGLAPGTYTLLFALAGYNNLRLDGITVKAGEETLADGGMKVM